MTDITLSAATVIALEALRWAAGPTVAYIVAGFGFAFCVGAMWGAGNMKRRLRVMKEHLEEIDR